MQCEQINFIWRCSAECNVGYVINQQYNRQHACRSGGWDPPFPQAYDNMICVRKYSAEHTGFVSMVVRVIKFFCTTVNRNIFSGKNLEEDDYKYNGKEYEQMSNRILRGKMLNFL